MSGRVGHFYHRNKTRCLEAMPAMLRVEKERIGSTKGIEENYADAIEIDQPKELSVKNEGISFSCVNYTHCQL